MRTTGAGPAGARGALAALVAVQGAVHLLGASKGFGVATSAAAGARSARVDYTVGPNTVRAVLHFDDSRDLVDFVSADRLVASPDGKTFTRQRWSTPVHGHQTLGDVRVLRQGEGRWHPEDGPACSFIELSLTALDIDLPGRAA